jgi:hypothetical protein
MNNTSRILIVEDSPSVDTAFAASLQGATLAEVRRQRDLLAVQVRELRAIVHSIPSIILNARLDQQQGIPTKYDYARAAKACEIRVA